MSIRSALSCVLLTLASMSACPTSLWAQRGFSAEDSFNRMDRNGDGVLTADETERLPSFMRDEFTKQGLDFSRGVRKSDFDRAAPQAFESIRSRFSQGGGRGGPPGGPPGMSPRGGDSRRSDDERGRDDERRRDEGRDSDRRRGDPSSSSRESTRTPEPTARRVITKTDPVTIELQKDFQIGDTDHDGQLAFYEWRQWKPNDLAGFLRLDANGDGFVTPREIKFPPQAATAVAGTASTASSATSTSSTAGPARMTTTPVATSAAPVDPNAIDRNSVQAKRAIYFFTQLDKNKDGTVVLEEWASSRTIKPQFERGGVDLSEPLSEDVFIAHFLRLNEKQ